MGKIRGAKRIDAMTVRCHRQVYKVDIYMEKAVIGATVFHAVVDQLNLKISDKSIDELRRRIDDEVKVKAQLEFTRFIVIHTSSGTTPTRERVDEHLAGAELRLTYEVVEIATRPDGSKIHRYVDQWSCGGELNGDVKTRMPDKSEKYNPRLDSPPEAVAMLPYTTANLVALEMIREAMATLGERLLALLSPDTAQNSLKQVARNGVKHLTDTKTKGG